MLIMKISNAKLLKKEDTKDNLREENLSKINLHARYYVFIFAISSLAFMQQIIYKLCIML